MKLPGGFTPVWPGCIFDVSTYLLSKTKATASPVPHKTTPRTIFLKITF